MKPLTFQQFRGACAVVDSGFNISRAADAMHTTQSAVSKSIKGLEDDLGAAIFARSAVRMVGLTEYGRDFIGLARGILRDAEFAVTRAQEDVKRTRGIFRIATTHVHARYLLPTTLQTFKSHYPDITVQIEQSDAAEVARSVASRRVHIGIAGTSIDPPSGLITVSAMHFERCIVVPLGHELLTIKIPTLADVARYPFVTYPEHHPAGLRLMALFHQHGLQPNVVLTATDATVLKEYVATGMGVAIVPKIVMGPEDAHKLAVIDASNLLPPTETNFLFRHGEYLRAYVYDFAEAFSPQWSRRALMSEIERQSVAAGHVLGSAAH